MNNPFNRNSITNKCYICKQLFDPVLLKKYGRTCSVNCFMAWQFESTRRIVDQVKLNELENRVIDYLTKFYKPVNRWKL